MDDKYVFRINKIEINSGEIIEPKRINIIVGPNNAGKSRFIKDLKQTLVYEGSSPKKNVIIKSMEYSFPTSVETFINSYNLESIIKRDEYGNCYIKTYSGMSINHSKNNISDYFEKNHQMNYSDDWKLQLSNIINDLNNNEEIVSSKQELKTTTIDKEGNKTIVEEVVGEGIGIDKEYAVKNFFIHCGELFSIYLGTEEKLMMCKSQGNHGIKSSQINFLSSFRDDGDTLLELKEQTLELFGKDIILDLETMGERIGLKTGDDFSKYRDSTKSDTSYNYLLEEAPLLEEEGDGLKNFAVTFLTLKSKNKNIILLDEPESFLHPPHANKLGEIIAKTANEEQQIYISTHSDDLVRGIINNTDDVNIIRITREANINKIKKIESEELKKIQKQPLLISSNIFKGLFSKQVFITESFSDSLIYSQICAKTNKNQNVYFVNTEGKAKIPEVAKFYEKAGVKHYSIFDFDYFRDKDIINSSLHGRVPDVEYQKVSKIPNKINDYVEKKLLDEGVTPNDDSYKGKKKNKKDEICHKNGISGLPSELQQDVERAIEILKDKNIIVLKSGCLETTLKQFGIDFTTDKNRWCNEAIELIENLDAEELKTAEVYDILFKDTIE